MSALTTALCKCHETLKLIDHADCKNDAVWNAVIDTQAEAERALRDGEKQEMIGYVSVNAERILKEALEEGMPQSMRLYNDRYPDRNITRPVYTPPAPAIPAVVAVPEAVLARTEEIRQAMGNPTGVGRHTLIGYTECLLAHIAFTNSTQPAAAPSGDAVEGLLKIMEVIRVFGDFYSKTQAAQALKEYRAAITATKE